jgi:hypothetical protein
LLKLQQRNPLKAALQLPNASSNSRLLSTKGRHALQASEQHLLLLLLLLLLTLQQLLLLLLLGGVPRGWGWRLRHDPCCYCCCCLCPC